MRKLPAGFKLLVGLVLASVALAARTTEALAILTLVDALILAAVRAPLMAVWKDVRLAFWQTVIIVALHMVRFRGAEGIEMGLVVSWRLFLAYLPAALIVRSTPQSEVVRALARVLPERLAFVMGVCLRSFPVLLADLRNLYHVQVLRGARVRPADVLKPRNWPELISCLAVPAAIRTLAMAGEIALAARARDFGTAPRRTHWVAPPG